MIQLIHGLGLGMNQIRRNIASSYVNQFAAMIGMLAVVPLCLRFLGHRLYGEWVVITTICTYLPLANIGIDQVLTNRIAEAVADGRRTRARSLICTAFVF